MGSPESNPYPEDSVQPDERPVRDPLDHGPEHRFTVIYADQSPQQGPGYLTSQSPEGSARDATEWIAGKVAEL
jgi:hypothetical protein